MAEEGRREMCFCGTEVVDGGDVFFGRPCIQAWLRGGVSTHCASRAIKHDLCWSSLTQRGCEKPANLKDKAGGEKLKSATGREVVPNQVNTGEQKSANL